MNADETLAALRGRRRCDSTAAAGDGRFPVEVPRAPWTPARAVIALAHPGPSAATVAVALLLMALLARGHPPGDKLALVAAMLLCQQVAISLHNDWCDRALDAMAKPWRAIPS